MIEIVEKFEWEGSTELNRLVGTVGAGCEEKLCNFLFFFYASPNTPYGNNVNSEIFSQIIQFINSRQM